MPTSLVSRFISALDALEQSGNDRDMIALFDDDATLTNTASPHTFEGRDGASAFWRSYRGTFGDIRSEFTKVIESGALAALEWTATGTLTSGQSVEYSGVTLLEFDDDRIRSFRSYFNPLDLPRATKRGRTASGSASRSASSSASGSDDKDVQLHEGAEASDSQPTDPSYATPANTPY